MHRQSNSGLFGLLVILFSYIFLFLYISWMLADYLPKTISDKYPSKLYRFIIPGIIFGSLFAYLAFNWVSWKIELQK